MYRPQDVDFKTGFELPEKNNTKIFHRSHSDSTTLIHLAFELPRNPVPGYFDLMENILSENIENLEIASKKNFDKSLQSLKGEIRQSPIGNFLIAKATLIESDHIDGLTQFLSNGIMSFKFSIKKDAVSVFETSEKTSFYKSLEKPHMFGIYNAHIFAQKGIDGFLSSFDESLYENAAETLKKIRMNGEPTVIIHHPMDSNEKNESLSDAVKLFDHDGSGTSLIAKQNASSPLLAVHYLMKHKASLENTFGKDAAKILHNCFGQRMKSEKIQKQIAPFGFTFTVNDNPWIPMDNIYLHDDFGYIRVEGLADDMDAAIGFLNKAFLNFIPTEDEFNKANDPSHGGYGGMSHKNMAKEKFNSLVDKHIYPEIIEQSEPPKLTYDSLIAFAKEYWVPENAIISVVSPATPEDVNQLFSGFGSNNEIDTTTPNEKRYQLNFESVTIDENGGGAQSYLFWGFMKEVNPKDKPALTALSLILRDKIVFDIREKQGMAYRMHAGISIKKEKALFSINFGTRPENADVLIPQFPGFFSLNMLNDVDSATLEKSVNMYLGRMMFRRLSSINQAYYLGHSQYFDGNMNSDSEFLEGLKSVTLDDVKRVAKKYMDGKNPISITIR